MLITNQYPSRVFWRMTSGPGAVSWGTGRIDVVARGTDNAIWHQSFNGTWSGWASLGGALIGGPDICSWAPGRLDVFARGGDRALWHKWNENGWSDWESLGGTITSDPSAVCWSNGRIDVFARGADGRLAHKWFDSGWSDWENLGGVISSTPDVASWGPNRLDVFARGTDGQPRTLVYDGAWQPWKPLGGQIVGDPGATATARDRMALVATGLDLGLWLRTFGRSGTDEILPKMALKFLSLPRPDQAPGDPVLGGTRGQRAGAHRRPHAPARQWNPRRGRAHFTRLGLTYDLRHVCLRDIECALEESLARHTVTGQPPLTTRERSC